MNDGTERIHYERYTERYNHVVQIYNKIVSIELERDDGNERETDPGTGIDVRRRRDI